MEEYFDFLEEMGAWSEGDECTVLCFCSSSSDEFGCCRLSDRAMSASIFSSSAMAVVSSNRVQAKEASDRVMEMSEERVTAVGVSVRDSPKRMKI